MLAVCAATLASAGPPAASAAQPAGRAYELVSPADKNGSDVIAETSRTRAAAFEAPGLPMAASFASLGGFADVQGTGISVEYLAQRTGRPGTSGWETHAITPAQEPLSFPGAILSHDPLYEGDFSPGLTHGVFRAWSPLTDAPEVDGVVNLYLRGDLRTPGAGAYALLTGAVAPLPPLDLGSAGLRPYLAAASGDFAHVLFESRLNLTPDAGGDNVKLYKAGDGGVRLLAPLGASCPALPAPADAAPCSAAGLGAAALASTSRTLSADGARAIVTAPITATGNVSTSAGGPSRLHQLDDRGTATPADDLALHVSASERTPAETPQAARFQGASTDGERVFLTSAEKLTDADASGLYLWRRQPDGDGHRLTLIGPGATAVVGVAEDGGRAYFLAPGQLLAGGPAVTQNGLYLWQEAAGAPGGTLSFVGEVSFADSLAIANLGTWNLTPSVARMTPDGGALLLSVSDGEGLAPGRDHGACAANPNRTTNGRCSQLYLYRADGSAPLAPDLRCVSCRPGGGAATANAYVNVRDGAGASQVTWHLSRALSDDGRRVFFSTAQALASGDANGRVDVYEHDVPSGATRLISSAGSAADAWFMDASASGDDVFFVTRERLVGWDRDAAYDLYDARAGGGFPEPPAPPAPCTGEACRGLARTAPAPPQLGSAVVRGSPPAARRAARRARRRRARGKRCKRGFVTRRVRTKSGRVKRRCVRRGAKAKRGARGGGRRVQRGHRR